MAKKAFFGEKHKNFPNEGAKEICADLERIGYVEFLAVGRKKAFDKGENKRCSDYPPDNKPPFRAAV